MNIRIILLITAVFLYGMVIGAKIEHHQAYTAGYADCAQAYQK